MDNIQNYGITNQLSSKRVQDKDSMLPNQIYFKGQYHLRKLVPNKADRESLKLIIFGPIVQRFATFIQLHPRLNNFINRFIYKNNFHHKL